MAIIDTKIANQTNLVEERFITGRNDDVRAKAGGAVHGRVVAVDEHSKDILNAAVLHGQIHGGEFAVMTGMMGNLAFAEYEGIEESAGDTIELDVAVGAVNGGVKRTFQMDGMIAARDHEIGHVNGAAGIDLAQDALKIIVGGKNTGDAMEDGEIGVLKCVLARDKSLARVARSSSGRIFQWREYRRAARGCGAQG